MTDLVAAADAFEPAAAPNPIVGAGRIARLVLGLQRLLSDRSSIELVEVNGETGILVRNDGQIIAIMAIETDGEHIQAVYAVVNPDKLPHM